MIDITDILLLQDYLRGKRAKGAMNEREVNLVLNELFTQSIEKGESGEHEHTSVRSHVVQAVARMKSKLLTLHPEYSEEIRDLYAGPHL